MEIEHILLLDIDGLRPDILAQALAEEHLPNLAGLLGGATQSRGCLYPVLAPAPSITFASQASLFSGVGPAQHGIPGNQFFDRFGAHSRGTPRHYAFDVGDTLAADDAVRVFTDGLASKCMLVPTLYERLHNRGWRSVVAGHMYARGATRWLKPSLMRLARFTKGGNLFGLSAPEYDRKTLEKARQEIERNGLPNILTVYFMGLDHESHVHGPQAQTAYLCDVLDVLVGELWQSVCASLPPGSPAPLCLIFSDHGQLAVPADDRHSLRLGFPYDREMGHLFDALGLDVHDFPGEDPNCDAVVASNGGLAHVYLQNRQGHWADQPDFERDVLPVARAFWQAHDRGRYAAELEGALAGVLVRNVQSAGWQAPYMALTPSGEIQDLEIWFKTQQAELYADPVNRLRELAGPRTGDLLLISCYEQGFYFASPLSGVHGGLHPHDSWATLALGWPEVDDLTWQGAQEIFLQAIWARCLADRGRLPTTADMLTGLFALLA